MYYIWGMKLDWYKLSAVVLLLASAAISVWAIGSVYSHVKGAEVEMMAMPGTSKSIPMPPKAMRQKIERLMRSGKAPGVVMIAPRQMQARCGVHGHLLGCVTGLGGMQVIYIRKGMSRELEHMALVHEYAHYLYDWEH